MNLFRYCGDDPVDRSDPLGLEYGDPFDTPDAVARDFNKIYNPRSIKANTEVGSRIYKAGIKYSYTEPAWGTGRDSKNRNPMPKNSTLAGAIHSHGDYSNGYVDRKGFTHITGRVNRSQPNWRSQDAFNSDNPSRSDKKFWHREGKGTQEYTGYTTTPGNKLWKQDGVNQNSKPETINPAPTNANRTSAKGVEPTEQSFGDFTALADGFDESAAAQPR
jgi:hypothetical protein